MIQSHEGHLESLKRKRTVVAGKIGRIVQRRYGPATDLSVLQMTLFDLEQQKAQLDYEIAALRQPRPQTAGRT